MPHPLLTLKTIIYMCYFFVFYHNSPLCRRSRAFFQHSNPNEPVVESLKPFNLIWKEEQIKKTLILQNICFSSLINNFHSLLWHGLIVIVFSSCCCQCCLRTHAKTRLNVFHFYYNRVFFIFIDINIGPILIAVFVALLIKKIHVF